jgi:hypothetical protein
VTSPSSTVFTCREDFDFYGILLLKSAKTIGLELLKNQAHRISKGVRVWSVLSHTMIKLETGSQCGLRVFLTKVFAQSLLLSARSVESYPREEHQPVTLLDSPAKPTTLFQSV